MASDMEGIKIKEQYSQIGSGLLSGAPRSGLLVHQPEWRRQKYLLRLLRPRCWSPGQWSLYAPGEMLFQGATVTREAHSKALLISADFPLDKESHMAKTKVRGRYPWRWEGRNSICQIIIWPSIIILFVRDEQTNYIAKRAEIWALIPFMLQ